MAKIILLLQAFALQALAFSFTTSASDPSSLQDFCVATNDANSAVFLNGKFFKDLNHVTPNDFFTFGLNKAGNITNPVGSKVTPVNVNNLPGLNMLGISLARIDYAPKGQNPPHTHPRASKILVVTQGTLLVEFVTSNPTVGQNKLFTKVLNTGDVFVFPKGLIHFQLNIGLTNAIAFAALSSQNSGVITIANAVFGFTPPISLDVLTNVIQVDKNTIAPSKTVLVQ